MIRTLAALVLCVCLALPAVASAETPAECWARKAALSAAGYPVTLENCGGGWPALAPKYRKAEKAAAFDSTIPAWMHSPLLPDARGTP